MVIKKDANIFQRKKEQRLRGKKVILVLEKRRLKRPSYGKVNTPAT